MRKRVRERRERGERERECERVGKEIQKKETDRAEERK